jgi:Transglycosylase-like domain
MTAILAAVALAVGPADASPCSMACVERVQRRVVTRHWREVVSDYGPSRLDARAACESGGRYGLATTGNGFWFSMQWEPRAWYGAGGRRRRGRPAGVWSLQPSRLEQRYRAVVWDRRHGGDPWPNCP